MNSALQQIVENILTQKPYKDFSKGDKFSLTEQGKPSFEKLSYCKVLNLNSGKEEAIQDAHNIIVHYFPAHIV